jgi:hypothetical protein
VHLCFDPNANRMERPLPEAVFIQTGNTDFNTLVNNRLAFERFQVAHTSRDFEETIQPVPWPRYALNLIITALNEDGHVSPRVRALVDCRLVVEAQVVALGFPGGDGLVQRF